MWEMELPSDYKECKVFELQEDKDISEKFTLGNLLRSFQKFTCEAEGICNAFPPGK